MIFLILITLCVYRGFAFLLSVISKILPYIKPAHLHFAGYYALVALPMYHDVGYIILLYATIWHLSE